MPVHNRTHKRHHNTLECLLDESGSIYGRLQRTDIIILLPLRHLHNPNLEKARTTIPGFQAPTLGIFTTMKQLTPTKATRKSRELEKRRRRDPGSI